MLRIVKTSDRGLKNRFRLINDRDQKVKSSDVFDLRHRMPNVPIRETPQSAYTSRMAENVTERPQQLLDGNAKGGQFRRDYLQKGVGTPEANHIKHGQFAIMTTRGAMVGWLEFVRKNAQRIKEIDHGVLYFKNLEVLQRKMLDLREI